MNSFTQNGAADLSDPNGRAIVRTGKGRGGIRIQLRFYHSPSLLLLLARFFEKKTSFESRSKENKNNPRLFPGCVENAKPVIYTNNTNEEEEDYPTEPDRFDSFSLDGWTTQLNRAGARVCACVCRVFAGGRGSRLLSRVEW